MNFERRLILLVLTLVGMRASAQVQTVQSWPLNTYARTYDGQWQGVKYASDGNVYFGSSTHDAHHGAGFFKYDPRTGQVTMLTADITVICGEDPQTNPQGKIHSDILELNGWLYFATYFGVDKVDAQGNNLAWPGWSGSHVIGYELATGHFRDFGVIRANYTIYSGIGIDPARNYIYVFETGLSAGQVSYIYRIDIATGAKTNLGQVGGPSSCFHLFVDQRGDVWFSIEYDNGTLRRIHGDTGAMDVYPNALPPLYLWNQAVVDPSTSNQSYRQIHWMEPLDGDRAVLTLGYYGGMLYMFDSTKPIASAFTNLQHIGYTDLGLAMGNNRVFYYQRANRGCSTEGDGVPTALCGPAPPNGVRDFHLLSVSLNSSDNYSITDHGLLQDQNGRALWRAPGMYTDGNNRVFMGGDWWTIPGDLGTLRYNYDASTGVESYIQLPRGEFFAAATVSLAPNPVNVSISAPASNQTISGTVTVSASASSSYGIAGVQFQVDGVNLGSEKTSAPYSVGWDTTAATNANHTLTAIARDAAGNRATASITVTVNNTVVTGGPTPAAYWTFDTSDISGNLALDRSSNHYNATIYGATSVTGKVGQALSFNGSSAYLAASGGLDLNTDLSLALWLKSSNTTRTEAVISKYDASGSEQGYLLRLSPNGTLSVQFGLANLAVYGNRIAADTRAINDGQWHHVAVVIQLNADVKFYIDGVLSSDQPLRTAAATNSSPFEMGTLPFTYYGDYFSGQMDEVRLYHQTLSASDIASLVSAGGVPVDTTPPTVSISAPANLQVVSGTVIVTATASDNTGVVGVQFQLDGVNLGSEKTSAPYSISWDTTPATNANHTLSAIARDAAGNHATASISVTVNNADTTPPTVSITTPVNLQTVSGTMTVAATASDNVAVAGVQFQVDGVNLGSEKTSAPYSISWDTTTASNANHTLSAVARDAAGNRATASITVTVNNTVVSGGPTPSAYWTFDTSDISGNLARDRSSNHYDATIYGATSVTGRVGQALAFNGSSAYLAASGGLDLNTDLSLAMWLKTSNTTRTEAVLSKYDSSGTERGYLLRMSPNGTVSVQFGLANLAVYGNRIAADTTAINDGQWHHVAVVIQLNADVKFYIDGVLSSDQPLPTAAATNSSPFEMGTLPFTYYGDYFSGQMDEVRLYHQTLSASDVSSLAH
jgi:hypothetical protein